VTNALLGMVPHDSGMLQSWPCPPSDPDCFRCGFVSFSDGLQPRRSAGRGSPGDAPPVGDWETVGRRGRAGQENPARTSLEVPGSSRAWLGGPTDARENLKKLRPQLGLRNN